MAIKSLLTSLLASSLPMILAAPTYNLGNLFRSRSESCPGTSSDAPQFFNGPFGNFPNISQWVSFNDMFNDNKQTMVDAGSTFDDVGRIAVAIENAAAQIGVDERVILGIIMQESHGYVGVQTTFDADGVPTGGLMQASGCSGFDGQNNLPQADTSQMVTCGTTHYKQNLEEHGNLLATSSILPALREYNSGSVDENDLSDAPNCVGNPF
ncbi:hypothetical protein LSUE1_G008296, partial [Lachnellula suecica]